MVIGGLVPHAASKAVERPACLVGTHGSAILPALTQGYSVHMPTLFYSNLTIIYYLFKKMHMLVTEICFPLPHLQSFFLFL